MPHDVKNELLKVGDKVTVEMEVAELYTATEYCNVRLIIPGENGPNNVTGSLTLNTKQVKKVE